jgi:spore germination protein YaaH
LTAFVPLLAAAMTPLFGGPAAHAAAPLSVIGFQEAGDRPGLIDASAPGLTSVGVDGVNLDTGGDAISSPGSRARAQLARAHTDGLTAVLLIGNFDESIEDFNESTAYALLGSRSHIAAVANQLASFVVSQGWDGVSVDLEALLRRDAPGLVEFLRALRADLPAQDTVNVDVTNYPSRAKMLAAGYDLPDIAAAVDEFTLMAYDEHGPWEKRPGPVASLGWTRHGLATVLGSVPAAKVDLGVAGYGYVWRAHQRFQVSDEEARRLVSEEGTGARFDQAVGEWTASLRDGARIWWSDARSFALWAAVASEAGLHGLAVWSLALSDPITASG